MPEPSLELLMQMVQKVLDTQREIREDVREIKHRLTSLESAVAGIKRDQAASYADTAA